MEIVIWVLKLSVTILKSLWKTSGNAWDTQIEWERVVAYYKPSVMNHGLEGLSSEWINEREQEHWEVNSGRNVCYEDGTSKRWEVVGLPLNMVKIAVWSR